MSPTATPATSLPLAIHLQDIHRTFGTAKHQVRAVDGVSLDVAPGEITALLGHNGAGKSTLIDIILGLNSPQKGTAKLFGMEPRQAIRKALVGTVFQAGALLPDLTVLQTLKMLKATYLETPPLEQILEETELTDIKNRRVSKLSGGEAQRLRLAIALLPNPWLMILDEPTAGMDAMMRRRFWALMELQAQAGRTILFATHYLQEAQDFAIRTVIMNHGKIVVDGATADVQRMDQTTTVTIDLPGAFPAHLKERWNATVTPVRHSNGSVSIHEATPGSAPASASGAGSSLSAGPSTAPAIDQANSGSALNPNVGPGSVSANAQPDSTMPTMAGTPTAGPDSATAEFAGLETAEIHVEIKTTDSDQAARELLALPGAHSLSVVPSTLEDAFAALADEDATEESDSVTRSKEHHRNKPGRRSNRYHR